MEGWTEHVSDEYQFDDNSKFQFHMDDDGFLGEVAKYNKLRLILQEKQECISKLGDQGLNELIKLEAPGQCMNLVMEGPANEFMNDVSSEEDDAEDWLRWVVHQEQQNMLQFEGG